MNTPERTQNGTPISKFEESPVFNFINNLSPIKPVESVRIQTFSTLSFPSSPSVFTSPHVSSLKESRFIRRNNFSGPSKPKVSENGKKSCKNDPVVTDARPMDSCNSHKLKETTIAGVSEGDASLEPPNQQSLFAIELPPNLKNDCGSSDLDPAHSCNSETDSVSPLPRKTASVIAYDQAATNEGSAEDEVNLQESCQVEPRTEGMECDWESLISNGVDFFIFNSPNETEAFKVAMQKSLGTSPGFGALMLLSPQNNSSVQKIYNVHSNDSVPQHGTGDYCFNSKHIEGEKMMDEVANISLISSNEPVSFIHRSMLRRCLDFEMAGAARKNSDDGSNGGSCMSQSDEKVVSNDKNILPAKRSGNSQRCILPGIGVHLNALATTCKDFKNVKHEGLSSGRQLSLPSVTSVHSPKRSQENPYASSISATSNRDIVPSEDRIQPGEDSSQALVCMVGEEITPNSPKKRRRKSEPNGEGDSCKRCNCKKSKCLKLYCECFAAGVYCIEPCSCQDCFNKPVHEDTVLVTRKQIESRNPFAFAPKVIRSTDSATEVGEESNKTPASARHKRGCNCKKSSCLKKYCECYQAGVGCSVSCRCEGCKNTFGRKDGIVVEPEEEMDAFENGDAEIALEKNEVQSSEENTSSALPMTPTRRCRPSIPLPFSFKGKPPPSPFPTTISSRLFTNKKLGKSSILESKSKIGKSFKTCTPPDDERPEVIHGNGSPSTCIKGSSPYSKRISSPHCDFASSPGHRNSRKLILQSIPSFPSLTPNH